MSRIGKSIKKENRVVIACGWEAGKAGVGCGVNASKYSLGGDKIFKNWDMVMIVQLCKLKTIELCTLNRFTL